MNLKLTIENYTKNKNIPTEKQIKFWVKKALNNKKINNILLGIRIINSSESAKLNSFYRNKKGSTNVLSFPYSEQIGRFFYLGDLALCAPLIAKEARDQNKSLHSHWAHLIIHGILHLLGYDHIKDREAKKMEKLETDILKKLGYPDPYIDRLSNKRRMEMK